MTLSVESGRLTERGPDVRTVTMRTVLADRPRPGAVEEMAMSAVSCATKMPYRCPMPGPLLRSSAGSP